MPGGFEIRGITFAKFKRYAKLPVRIVDTVQKKNGSNYAVFCYGTHEVLTVQESPLEPYQENFDEAVKKTTKRSSKCIQRSYHFSGYLLGKVKLGSGFSCLRCGQCSKRT